MNLITPAGTTAWLAAVGMTPADLAQILGKSLPTVTADELWDALDTISEATSAAATELTDAWDRHGGGAYEDASIWADNSTFWAAHPEHEPYPATWWMFVVGIALQSGAPLRVTFAPDALHLYAAAVDADEERGPTEPGGGSRPAHHHPKPKG